MVLANSPNPTPTSLMQEVAASPKEAQLSKLKPHTLQNKVIASDAKGRGDYPKLGRLGGTEDTKDIEILDNPHTSEEPPRNEFASISLSVCYCSGKYPKVTSTVS